MGNRRFIFLLGALAVNYLIFQSILVPHENGRAPWSSASEKYESLHDKVNFPSLHSAPKYFTVLKGVHNDANSGLVSERNSSSDVSEHGLELENVGSKKSIMQLAVLAKDNKVDFSGKQILETKRAISTISQLVKSNNIDPREYDRVGVGNSWSTTSSTNLTHSESSPQKNKFPALDNSTAAIMTKKKLRCDMPPKSRMLIQEMNRILVRRRRSSRAMVFISLSIMTFLPGPVIVMEFWLFQSGYLLLIAETKVVIQTGSGDSCCKVRDRACSYSNTRRGTFCSSLSQSFYVQKVSLMKLL